MNENVENVIAEAVNVQICVFAVIRSEMQTTFGNESISASMPTINIIIVHMHTQLLINTSSNIGTE